MPDPKFYEFDAAGGHWIVNVTGDGGASISTEGVKAECAEEEGSEEAQLADLYDAAIDGIESLVLALACAGTDVSTPEFVEAIETAVNACAQEYPEP